MADRVLVIYEGQASASSRPTTTEEELGVFMTGGGAKAGAA